MAAVLCQRTLEAALMQPRQTQMYRWLWGRLPLDAIVFSQTVDGNNCNEMTMLNKGEIGLSLLGILGMEKIYRWNPNLLDF